MNQRGFATLEVILMVMVIGILASIAVPRIFSITAAANTAKIQGDLSTIDTAIAVYQMEYGDDPADFDALVTAGYLQAKPEPPSGKCYVAATSGAEPVIDDVPTGGYTIVAAADNEDAHATLGDHKASDFYIPKKSAS